MFMPHLIKKMTYMAKLDKIRIFLYEKKLKRLFMSVFKAVKLSHY